ncbi:MAG: lipopolysaccharide biosynthesis protein [Clostridia bacterium]|nr:lipopolysaccharide biosynthesis protein [Clostridia bacterium]
MDQKDYSKKNILVNFVWRLLERFGAQGVTLIVSIILARLLDPTVYGTVALVTVITTILQVFVDSGFGNALVQKKDADDLDFSTVFTFNIAFSAILYALYFLLIPYITGFFGIQDTVSAMRVLGLIIIIAGFKGIQQAYVTKHLAYKKYFFATLGGTITAAVVGITMAYLGYGIWALIVQNVVNQTIDTIILWVTIKWKPKLRFSLKRFKSLFSYGWKFLVTGFINQMYNEIRTLIIGKQYSSADLAFYNKGSQFPTVIAGNLTASIDSILFPVMSEHQDDRERVKNITRRSISVGSYLLWPCMIGLAACSEPFILLLLSEKWISAVPYLQIFCIVQAFYPIHSANLNAIKALGRSDIYLYQDILKKASGFLIILLTMRFGVIWIALGCILANVVSQIINSFPNRKLLNYSWGQQLVDILPSLIISLVMGVFVYLVNFLNFSPVVTLLVQVPLGIGIYVGISWLFKLSSFLYCADTLKKLIRSKKKNKEPLEDEEK